MREIKRLIEENQQLKKRVEDLENQLKELQLHMKQFGGNRIPNVKYR